MELSCNVDIGVCVVENGKVIAAALDCVAPVIKFSNSEGLVPTEVTDTVAKQAKFDSYGMVAWGGAISEWYAQAQKFADTAIGKNIGDLPGLPTKNVAGCTIYAGGFLRPLIEAAINADDN